ncbi:MAG: LEPR-XLL domain-containing protein [Phycisphaerales bacterium]
MNSKHQSAGGPVPGLEPLEPRVLLSATTPDPLLAEPASASLSEFVASDLGSEVVYQEQTQYDNFFKPNVIAFDFPIDSAAINGVVYITALGDIDATSETVSFDAEGVVVTELFTAPDDGARPFTATINLSDPDLAALAADGNLHIELTPNANVDDFGDVSEYVTVGLTYELASTPIVLSPVMPLISGSYRGSVEGEIDYAADVDTCTLDLEAGQTVRFEAVPDTGLGLIVSLADPNGGVLYTSGFIVPGAAILPQALVAPEDGTYTISVASGGTLGAYSLNVFVNEAIEEESIGGASNNILADAQNLDDQFRDLGGEMSRAVVRGSTTSYVAAGNPAADFLLTESFEDGVIPAGWAVTTTGTGRVRFINTYGGSDGVFALIMDSSNSNSYGNNEAVWTVDLPSDRELTLSFDRITWSEGSNTLPTTYTGSRNGDGVSISDDGVNWYTVQNAWYTASPVWESTQIDLSAAAAAAGMTLGPGFQIKFQQYDNYPITSEGRGYDNIVISSDADHVFPSPLYDYYKFTLDAEQVASIQLNDPNGDPVAFRLYDPAGTLLTPSQVTSSSGIAGLYDFKAPSAGEYAIAVTQGMDDYLLSIELDGSIDNNAKRVDRTGTADGPDGRGGFRVGRQQRPGLLHGTGYGRGPDGV